MYNRLIKRYLDTYCTVELNTFNGRPKSINTDLTMYVQIKEKKLHIKSQYINCMQHLKSYHKMKY